MGEEDSKKQHVIFGSAGMAASGMMSGIKAKRKIQRRLIVPESDSKTEETQEASETAPSHTESAVFTGMKAAVIGHSGSGNFGRGLDTIFQRFDDVRLFALTDLNPETVNDVCVHAGAPAGYSDPAEMLEKESPDIVSVAATNTTRRFEQIKSVLSSGAHVLSEAPIARTLKESDELLALAKSSGLRIAARHPMRVDPHLVAFRAQMTDLIGDLCQIRVWGACDESAGGEDMLLNGLPLFDIARWFAGEVSFCTASISKDGIAAIAEDFHLSESGDFGPLLGDTIHAEFEMDSGVRVSFVSDRKLQPVLGPAGIEFVGTNSKMRLIAGAPVTLSYLANPNPFSATRTESWVRWPEVQGAYHHPVDHLVGEEASNRILMKDLIAAVSGDTAPSASGDNAAKALEMAHGVWQAGVTMRRAYFPLANRLHPLSEESQ